MNTKNSKRNEPQEFVLNLPQRLDLRISDKHVALQNLSVHYTRKNIRQYYKHNKLKIMAPTWNHGFELPEGSYSMSGIQGYIEYLTKMSETLPTNLPIHSYVNRINNRLLFKIKG